MVLAHATHVDACVRPRILFYSMIMYDKHRNKMIKWVPRARFQQVLRNVACFDAWTWKPSSHSMTIDLFNLEKIGIGKFGNDDNNIKRMFRDCQYFSLSTCHPTCRPIAPTSMVDLFTTYGNIQIHVPVHKHGLLIDINKQLGALISMDTNSNHYMFTDVTLWTLDENPSVNIVVFNHDTCIVFMNDQYTRLAQRWKLRVLQSARAFYNHDKEDVGLDFGGGCKLHVTVDSPWRPHAVAETRLLIDNFQTLMVALYVSSRAAMTMTYDGFCRNHACMPGNGLSGLSTPTPSMLRHANENFERLRPFITPQKPASWRQLLMGFESLTLKGEVMPDMVDNDDKKPIWFNKDNAVERALQRELFCDMPCASFTNWRRLVSDFNSEHVITGSYTDIDTGQVCYVLIDICY